MKLTIKETSWQLAGVLLLLLQFTPATYTASILFYSPLASYSHKIAMWPLVENVAARGHNVTFMSAFDKKPSTHTGNSNITDFVPKQFAEWFSSADESFQQTVFDNRYSIFTKIMDWVIMLPLGIDVCAHQLQDPEFIEWVHRSQFDLVIIDVLFNDCGYGLADLWGASTIVYSTSTLYPWVTEQFGLSIEPSWIPDTVFTWLGTGFWGRAWASLHPMIWNFSRNWFYMHHLDALFAEKFGAGKVRPILEIEQETRLMLLNSHFSADYARSLPPFVVPASTSQCDSNSDKNAKKSPLPKEFAEFVNRDARPIVYISFGSFADIFYHPVLLDTFTSVFRTMTSTKFIIKTKGAESSSSLDFPENVLAVKWTPQEQLLQHPHVRAFVSHTGLLSTIEAICAGVPIIAMPVFAEQDYNAARVHKNGYGIQLEIATVTKEQLIDTITKVIQDPVYSEKVKEAARMFNDIPESGTETAAWWVEYVLRHRKGDGLLALRPGTSNQTWYQRRQLDVWASLFGTFVALLIVLLWITKFIMKMLLRICCKAPKSKLKKS